MRKLLLFMMMIALGISVSMAQAVRPGPAGSKRMPIHQSLVSKQVKEMKVQKASISSLVMNQEKIISSVSRGDKKFQLVQNANGTFSKRVVLNNKTQKLNRQSTASGSKSAAADTFFESFEDWDGEDPDWTPAGWSRDNKTDFTTWEISAARSFVGITPTDGDYFAYVALGVEIDDDNNLIFADPRDEMLISPEFTPVDGDKLFFDVNYSALFMFLDYYTFEFDFENPVFNIQVLLSTDNGVNWDVIWDEAKNSSYTEDDIWDYIDNQWYSNSVSLASYAGKSIQIAFRYTDRDGGDNIGLDNISVREINPTALYLRPQGYFNAGLAQDWRSLDDLDLMLGHAYDPTVWRNLSTEADAYSWEFENPDGSGTTIIITDENPDVPYPYEWFDIPALTATGGGKSSNYQWGTSSEKYLQAGGNLDLGDGTFLGVGNYDLSYNFVSYYTSSVDDYLFGTTTDNSIDGVANYFEKPIHKYILEGVWAALGEFSYPADTEFTMVIHRVVDGYLIDEIATATCTTADVMALDGYSMPFTSFITIDPETGLEVENDYLEIEDAILIEIKGFNNIPGSKISFCTQEVNADPTGESNAYIFYISGEDRRLTYYVNVSTSLLFNLELTYSFLFADSDEFIVPEAGGEKTFDVISYYSPNDWWLEEALPEWLSGDFTFDDNTWEIQYTLIAEPLPADITYREAVVKIVTYGADMSISVQQGDNTGIRPVKTIIADTKVANKGNHFELTYSPDYSIVSVYSVTGQKIAGYRLPSTGTFAVPNGNYPQGVYLFNFTGAKGASTVKAIK